MVSSHGNFTDPPVSQIADKTFLNVSVRMLLEKISFTWRKRPTLINSSGYHPTLIAPMKSNNKKITILPLCVSMNLCPSIYLSLSLSLFSPQSETSSLVPSHTKSPGLWSFNFWTGFKDLYLIQHLHLITCTEFTRDLSGFSACKWQIREFLSMQD